MRVLLTVFAISALAATTYARQNGFSDIATVDEFIMRLNISSVVETEVRGLLNVSIYRTAGTDANIKARLACDVSRAIFGSKLSLPQSQTYGELVDDNWSMTCWLVPQCILQPASAKDVSKAMLLTSFTGSRFAIRSGGHNPNVGFSSVGSEGLLIDLSRLDGVSLSPDGSHAAIGPGNRWGRVYQILASDGRMAVGGRANDIGVGGFLLGGGLSYWSSIHGMAFNKVVNYEVVLGNASIINANRTHNEDLWWALRGGGANYGIVTKFDVETVKNGQIWFEGLLIDSSEMERFLQIAVDFAAVAENDPDASATYNLGPSGSAVYLAYNKPIERPSIFSPFYRLAHRPLFNSTIGTWHDYHKAVSALNPFGSLRVSISVYDRKWDIATILDHYRHYQNVSTEIQDQLNATLYFAPQLFSKFAVQKALEGGGSPLGLKHETHCFLEIMITWTDPSHDQEAIRRLQSLGQEIDASAGQFGTDLSFHYMNDAGSFQDVLKSYGSVELMKSISRAYDPLRVFQKLQYGGFLLDSA